ncbi:MAG TPA: OB-fold nucleic acid binding domain-containing protein, partial [Phycisphaerales bacterium]|nr:OB-fold nucleic acid binding domain-containing protein [Phycisphaerales bacterium]
MADQPTITLRTPIASLPKVNEKFAHALRLLGIKSVANLIRHFPHRYERQHSDTTIAKAGEIVGPIHHAHANVAVTGEIAAVRAPMKRNAPFQATLMDSTGTMQLLWFHAPWMRGKLHPGMAVRVSGTAKRHGDYLQMANPQFHILTENATPKSREDRLIPVYSATENAASEQIESLIRDTLPAVLPHLTDHFTEAFRADHAFPTLADAYRAIHQPEDEEVAGIARRRLVYDEFLLHQLAVMLKRHHRREQSHSPPLKLTQEIDRRIRARFPFKL